VSGCRSSIVRHGESVLWRIDLAPARGDLQPDRVARFETAGRGAFGCLPPRRPSVVRGQIRRGVQAQARDDGVSVAVARINRDPFAATAFAELAKLR